KTLTVSADFFVRNTQGQLLNQMTMESRAIESAVAAFSKLYIKFLMFIALVFVVVFMDWKLAFAGLGLIILTFSLMERFWRLSPAASAKVQIAKSELNETLLDSLMGTRVIRIFGLQNS